MSNLLITSKALKIYRHANKIREKIKNGEQDKIKLLTNLGVIIAVPASYEKFTPDYIETVQKENNNQDKINININEFNKIKFIGDGDTLSLEDAKIINTSNQEMNIGNLMLFIDDIIGVII